MKFIFRDIYTFLFITIAVDHLLLRATIWTMSIQAKKFMHKFFKYFSNKFIDWILKKIFYTGVYFWIDDNLLYPLKFLFGFRWGWIFSRLVFLRFCSMLSLYLPILMSLCCVLIFIEDIAQIKSFHKFCLIFMCLYTCVYTDCMLLLS